MATTTTRFAAKTLAALVAVLASHRESAARSAESLHTEATDALSQRDISDLLDAEDPSTDSDAATVLILVQQAEARLRRIEEALDRLADGTYGYCTACGEGIPLIRLRALPAAANCIECSRRSSRGVDEGLDHEYLRLRQIRSRSSAGCGLSTEGGEQ